MKRWIRFVALFYPRGWREEFGEEFDSVLDEVRPGWRVFGNVLKGAVAMRISEGAGWMKLVGATAAVGALAAFGMSFLASQQSYRSSATLNVISRTDPVRPESPEIRQQRAFERVNEMRVQILSRSELSSIINDPRLLLYKKELKTTPLDEVIERMRRDLQIQVVPPAKDGPSSITLHVSFLYPDQAKAQETVLTVETKFLEQNHNMSKEKVAAYQNFWGDMSQLKHAPPAPPPPMSDVIHVYGLKPPAQSPPNRVVFLAWGLLVGLLVGMAIRWPRGFVRLAAFGVMGFVLAAGVSFLLPSRYTSTAVMQISPALLTEDPHVSPPPATPAAEFLKQIEPELLSDPVLARIIEDDRLNLYSEERSRKPMNEIVGEMRTNLRIGPVDSSPGGASAFHISFTYLDRFKAQQAVEMVMTVVQEMNQTRAKASAMDFMRHVIWERKAGEVVDVLDTASLPSTPVWPNRLLIELGGLCVGVLLGMFKFWRRRTGPPPQLNSNEMVLSNGV